MDTTPASLLERVRQRTDADAWARFVTLYSPLIRHWVHRLGLRDADAADLIQDVFVELLEKLPAFRYDPHQRFRGWLWTLTLNKCRDWHRRRARVGAPAGAAEPAVPDDSLAFDEQEYRHYLVGRVLRLLQSDFEPATWRAFWEYVANDRPAAEVAAELNLSLDAVYTAKARVLRRLRAELEGLLD